MYKRLQQEFKSSACQVIAFDYRKSASNFIVPQSFPNLCLTNYHMFLFLHKSFFSSPHVNIQFQSRSPQTISLSLKNCYYFSRWWFSAFSSKETSKRLFSFFLLSSHSHLARTKVHNKSANIPVLAEKWVSNTCLARLNKLIAGNEEQLIIVCIIA